MLVLSWGCGRNVVWLSTYYQCTGFEGVVVLDFKSLEAQKFSE